MKLHRSKHWKVYSLLSGIMILTLFILACGDAKEPTPTPSPTVDIAGLIETAITKAMPEAVSAQEIQALVEKAVSATAAEAVTEAQVATAIGEAIAEAAAAAPEPLTASDIERIVTAAIPPPLPFPTSTPTPTPTATPRRIPTPTETVPVVVVAPRLRVANSPQILEIILPWKGPAVPANVMVRPFLDPLIQTGHPTGELVPGLAASWEVDPGFTTWTYTLREDVPFHQGWGEFTSKDVTHSIAFNLRDDANTSDAAVWRRLVGETEEEMLRNVQTPNDHTVVFNLKAPELDWLAITANTNGNVYIMSKDQWDAEGLAGYERLPAGTGSWQYVGRELGKSILYESTLDHWRKTPEFKELQLIWVRESATRLALQLAGEVDISEIDRSLHPAAKAVGMVVAESFISPLMVRWYFGGQYHPDKEGFDPTVPYHDARVREAVNLAINREELMNSLFGLPGRPAPVFGFFSDLEGFDPQWVEQYGEHYRFDPDRARELLAEAGYPDGFKTTVVISSLPGVPEAIEGSQAIAQYLQAIGIETDFLEMEFSRLRVDFRERFFQNHIVPSLGGHFSTSGSVRVNNLSPPRGIVHTFESQVIEDLYDQYIGSLDPEERGRLLREIGQFKFDNYTEIPIAEIPGQIVINPNRVAEYIWPGAFTGFSHFEYAKAVR